MQILVSGVDNNALDDARALLDAMTPVEVAASADALLDWTLLPGGAPSRLHIQRERCRLLSYAAIMHGGTLLPHVADALRSIVAAFDDGEEAVHEELLRTVGNIARYVLTAKPLPADALLVLTRPLLVGAGSPSSTSTRRTCCFRAMNRVLAESPRRALEDTQGMLSILHMVVTALREPAQQPPSSEALLPLVRLVQLLGKRLPDTDMHIMVQLAIDALQGGPSIRRAGCALLQQLSPLLLVRTAQPYVRELVQLVCDELRLLPEALQQGVAVGDLLRTFRIPLQARSSGSENDGTNHDSHTLLHGQSSASAFGEFCTLPSTPGLQDDSVLVSASAGPAATTSSQKAIDDCHHLSSHVTASDDGGRGGPFPERVSPLSEGIEAAEVKMESGLRIPPNPTEPQPTLSRCPRYAAEVELEGLILEAEAAMQLIAPNGPGSQPSLDHSDRVATAQAGLLGAAGALRQAEASVCGFVDAIAHRSATLHRASDPTSDPTARSKAAADDAVSDSTSPRNQPAPTLPPSPLSPALPPMLPPTSPPSPQLAPTLPPLQGCSPPQSGWDGTQALPPPVPHPLTTPSHPSSHSRFVSHAYRTRTQLLTHPRSDGHTRIPPTTLGRAPPSHRAPLPFGGMRSRVGRAASRALREQLRRDRLQYRLGHGVRADGVDVRIFLPPSCSSSAASDATSALPADPYVCHPTVCSAACPINPKLAAPTTVPAANPREESASRKPRGEQYVQADIPEREGGVLTVTPIRDGVALGFSELIARLRTDFVHDLNLDSKLNAKPDPKPHPMLDPETALPSSQPDQHLSSCFQDLLQPAATRPREYMMRSRDIVTVHRSECEHATRQLMDAYRQQVAKLQSVLVHQLGELGAATERNIRREIYALDSEGRSSEIGGL